MNVLKAVLKEIPLMVIFICIGYAARPVFPPKVDKGMEYLDYEAACLAGQLSIVDFQLGKEFKSCSKMFKERH